MNLIELLKNDTKSKRIIYLYKYDTCLCKKNVIFHLSTE